MILLFGIPSEAPLAMVTEHLEAMGVPAVLLNQRRVDAIDVDVEVVAGRVTGLVRLEGERYPLEAFDGVYLRPMDDRFLPELADEPEGSPRRRHSRQVHDLLLNWSELTCACVVNRPSAMGSNSSKPYQGQLIAAAGLRVPETLVTNDPDEVVAFADRVGALVYKAVSGARTVVQRLDAGDFARLERIRWCPVQFQEYVDGRDVRVHVVGEQVFATAVISDAVDYRYARRLTDTDAVLEPETLSGELAAQCVAVTQALGLTVSGIDLRLTAAGEAVCFEVNPCPAFSYYERGSGQPIAAAVARRLTAGR